MIVELLIGAGLKIGSKDKTKGSVMPTVSVVIPTRNEEKNVAKLIPLIEPYGYRIIVCDDSDDNTEPMDPPPPHQQPLSNSIWDHKLVDNSPGINPFQSTNPQTWTDYLYPIDSLEEIREYEETRNMEDEDYYWE